MKKTLFAIEESDYRWRKRDRILSIVPIVIFFAVLIIEGKYYETQGKLPIPETIRNITFAVFFIYSSVYFLLLAIRNEFPIDTRGVFCAKGLIPRIFSISIAILLLVIVGILMY